VSKIFVLARSASPVLLLVSFSCAQLLSQTQSLGDVAREQKEIRNHREKDGETTKAKPKPLTNEDLASDSTSTSGDQSVADENPPAKSQPAETGNERSVISHANTGSVLDRPKDSKPDEIVVPAGTELKVDIGQHKIVIPVRVGFATPIPALSRVTVDVTRSYVGISAFSSTPYPTLADVDYVEYATVTAITVAGNTYEVQTNSVPLLKGATNNEVTFVLGAPLKILR